VIGIPNISELDGAAGKLLGFLETDLQGVPPLAKTTGGVRGINRCASDPEIIDASGTGGARQNDAQTSVAGVRRPEISIEPEDPVGLEATIELAKRSRLVPKG
jgi:hypothetical protein